jgi:integrase/recombinase XerD
MFLFKRNDIYYLEYFDDFENKLKRISTKCKFKSDAIKFISNFNKRKVKESIKPPSLHQFIKEYLGQLELTQSKSYLRTVTYSLDIFKNYIGKDVPLNQLKVNDLEKFFTDKFSKSKYSAFLHYRNLRSAFQKAVFWNYLEINIIKKIKLPKIAKSFPIFISENQFQLIIKNTKEENLRDLFYTAFYTGMRLGELVNIKWSWIDFNQNLIKIKNSEIFTTKSKKERIIPINKRLYQVLKNRIPKILKINDDEFVFYRIKGICYNEDFVSKQFKKSVRASGLDDKIHFHTLRHSFASLLVQRGVSLYVVKELLGHEDLSTTQIYSHLQRQNLMDAVNLL